MKYSQEMIQSAGPKSDVQQMACEIQVIIEDPQFWAQVLGMSRHATCC